jgi:VWFA-related protein
MFKRLMLSVAGVVSLGLLLGHSGSLSAAPRQDSRSVHVAVVNNDGTPVPDMTAADFEVKEGGKSVTLTSATITDVPLRLALIVADEGTGSFQQSMVTLIKPLIALGEFKLVSVVMQPETIVDYTSDAERLVAGVEKMGQRASGQPSGAQLMEAIVENLQTVAQPGKRPVIVVMRFGGAATSQIRQEDVRETMRKSGTQLFALSPQGGGGGGGGMPMNYGGAGGAMGQARQDYAASESTYRSRNLESVLNDGSKQSGGRHIYFSAQTIIPEIEKLAQELQSQYQLSYTLPAGTKPSDRLQVTSKRRGTKVLAPERIAN